jgi:hypothetical protein
MLDARECERARIKRDRRFDGRFFTGVRTTKIYCRPACAVRPAKASNVSFYRGRTNRHAADMPTRSILILKELRHVKLRPMLHARQSLSASRKRAAARFPYRARGSSVNLTKNRVEATNAGKSGAHCNCRYWQIGAVQQAFRILNAVRARDLQRTCAEMFAEQSIEVPHADS